MKERISALVDGELEQAELVRDLKQLASDRELQDAWAAYHLIGDALRGRSVSWYADKVRARLAEEPALDRPSGSILPSLRHTGFLAMSLGAGIAAVMLVAWMAIPQAGEEPLPTVPAEKVAKMRQAPLPKEFGDYLLAHQRFSPAGAMQGVAAYVRTSADEGEK